jgi:glycosyltransferase involved in cell wall biosynthesis
LPRVLDTLPGGAPVLIVDAESSDDTVAIARARGAEVVVRPWEGFVATRRFAQNFVKTPWTFMLDADEMLDEKLRDAVIALEPPSATDGYLTPRTTFFCGRPITGCGWGEEAPLRLFRTARAFLMPRPAAGGYADVHEEWRVYGSVGRLRGTVLHDSYPTLAAYWAKFDRYTSIEALGLKPTQFDAMRTVVTAFARLPWLFFVRRGYRDGWRGAIIAFASAIYPVVSLSKAMRGEQAPVRG